MLFTGKGSVRMVKNCDLGLENAALGLRPLVVFSGPRSQFFTIWTSQPANNIPNSGAFILVSMFLSHNRFLSNFKALSVR